MKKMATIHFLGRDFDFDESELDGVYAALIDLGYTGLPKPKNFTPGTPGIISGIKLPNSFWIPNRIIDHQPFIEAASKVFDLHAGHQRQMTVGDMPMEINISILTKNKMTPNILRTFKNNTSFYSRLLENIIEYEETDDSYKMIDFVDIMRMVRLKSFVSDRPVETKMYKTLMKLKDLDVLVLNDFQFDISNPDVSLEFIRTRKIRRYSINRIKFYEDNTLYVYFPFPESFSRRRFYIDKSYAYDYVKSFYTQSVKTIVFPKDNLLRETSNMTPFLIFGCTQHWGPITAVMSNMLVHGWNPIVEKLLSEDLLTGLIYRPEYIHEVPIFDEVFLKNGDLYNENIYQGIDLRTPKLNLKVLDIPQTFHTMFGRYNDYSKIFPNLERLGCLSGEVDTHDLKALKEKLPHLKEIILYYLEIQGPYFVLPYVRYEKIKQYKYKPALDSDSDSDDYFRKYE